MLIVFGGLPGTGKSSIACLLAKRLKATYVRIDTIEQALRQCGTLPHGVVTEGYTVGYAVAEDNLRGGGTVIADCVHPLTVTRDAWVAVARRAAVPILAVEVICSDIEEHRRRVETRVAISLGWCCRAGALSSDVATSVGTGPMSFLTPLHRPPPRRWRCCSINYRLPHEESDFQC